jgi:ABC-type multidrug transport system fused ATPase/permease subunit
MSGAPLMISMPRVGARFALLGGAAAQLVVLAAFRWWAPVVLGGAWVATNVLLRKSSRWDDRSSPEVSLAQRHAQYAYRLMVDPPAAKEVRVFGLAQWLSERFAVRRRDVFERSWYERRLRWPALRWSVLLVVAGNGFVFWAMAGAARSGELDLVGMVVVAQCALGAAGLAFGDDYWVRAAAQPVPKVLALAGAMSDAGDLQPGSADAAGAPAGEIRFEGVRFAYERQDAPVLDGFDLTIPAGTSMAIVGQNGAGKTTLTKLLCRLYDPTEGTITIDGADLRSFDIRSWRDRVAVVFQDFVRYELPLRHNVALAGATDDDVRDALRLAGADGIAELDTILAPGYQGGTDLSGGQWQRIALARALHGVATGAGVVILDEPTAHLDVRGEQEIFDQLLTATKGCTTILVSHRFSTVRHADCICVVEGGLVAELGTHDELMARGGRYHTMFRAQAARFEEDTDATV